MAFIGFFQLIDSSLVLAQQQSPKGLASHIESAKETKYRISQGNQTGESEQLIQVKQIEIVGNTVFSDSELKKVISPLPKGSISLSKLYELRSKITDFYVNQGYISSAAFVSPQQFSNGIVTIQIIEGVLAEVEINGLSKIKESYITRRLPLGKPLNKKVLFASLAKLNDDALIKNLNAQLVRLTPNENILILKLEEKSPLKTQFNLNNSFSPSIGTFGGTASIKYYLLGYGDFINLDYGLTQKGGSSRYGGSYTIPFNAQNGVVSFQYTNADSTIIEEPIVSALDIQSDLTAYNLNVMQPIDLGVNQQLSFGLSLEHIRSQSLVNGTSFAFTEGLPDGEVRLSALRLVQEYNTKNDTNSLIARSQFSLGLDLFDATVTETGIDGLFWSWRGQAQWLKKLGQAVLVSNLNVQLSDDKLLPIEQISLGGANSVRGYRENLSIGDNGVIGGFEVQVPIFRFANQKGVIKIIPFINAGKVWNNSGEEIPANTLVSTGVGLNLELDKLLQARINYAIPLTQTDLPGDYSRQKITFDLLFQP